MKTKQKHTHRTQKIKRLFAKIYTKEHVYTYICSKKSKHILISERNKEKS